MQPKVEIILVKYNAPAFERKAVEAVLAATDYSNYSLTVHQNERGVHLSACWNRLIAASDAEYICLLNTDTVVTPGWLAGLMDCALHHTCVAVVPSSNRVHLSEIETPGLAQDEQDVAKINEFAKKNDMMWYTSVTELPTASGMCVVFPRKIWEQVGGFDEGFFLYGEDTDFFTRAAKLGRILWHRGVYVHHYGSQSVARAVANGEFDYAAVRTAAQERYDAKHPVEGEFLDGA